VGKRGRKSGEGVGEGEAKNGSEKWKGEKWGMVSGEGRIIRLDGGRGGEGRGGEDGVERSVEGGKGVGGKWGKNVDREGRGERGERRSDKWEGAEEREGGGKGTPGEKRMRWEG